LSARFGKYVIERQLAVGGMAEVYLGRQSGPAGFSKPVVIKRILPHLANDDRFIRMFLDEARLAARLHHPNIVHIYELGDVGGAYFIAMEYVPGHSLAKLLARARAGGKTIPWPVAARIVSKVCGGLEYAHAFKDEEGKPLRLVHRDVSPDNVLVTPEGAVKMIDFGVARAASTESGRQQGVIKGKFAYMSPEQVMGKRLDGRSDIFSLGIVLYELTTLQRPFGDADDLNAVEAIVHEPHVSPESLVPGYPPELATIVEKALQKNRTRRYGKARDLERDLERFISERKAYVSDREIGQLAGELIAAEPLPPDSAPDPVRAETLVRAAIPVPPEEPEELEEPPVESDASERETEKDLSKDEARSRASRADTLILAEAPTPAAGMDLEGRALTIPMDEADAPATDVREADTRRRRWTWLLLLWALLLAGMVLLAWGAGLLDTFSSSKAAGLEDRSVHVAAISVQGEDRA